MSKKMVTMDVRSIEYKVLVENQNIPYTLNTLTGNKQTQKLLNPIVLNDKTIDGTITTSKFIHSYHEFFTIAAKGKISSIGLCHSSEVCEYEYTKPGDLHKTKNKEIYQKLDVETFLYRPMMYDRILSQDDYNKFWTVFEHKDTLYINYYSDPEISQIFLTVDFNHALTLILDQFQLEQNLNNVASAEDLGYFRTKDSTGRPIMSTLDKKEYFEEMLGKALGKSDLVKARVRLVDDSVMNQALDQTIDKRRIIE